MKVAVRSFLRTVTERLRAGVDRVTEGLDGLRLPPS